LYATPKQHCALTFIIYTVAGYLILIHPTVINEIDMVIIYSGVNHGYYYVMAASKTIPRLNGINVRVYVATQVCNLLRNVLPTGLERF
jgi:hypothetical protein